MSKPITCRCVYEKSLRRQQDNNAVEASSSLSPQDSRQLRPGRGAGRGPLSSFISWGLQLGSQKEVPAFILLTLGWDGEGSILGFLRVLYYYRDFSLPKEVLPVHWDFRIH